MRMCVLKASPGRETVLNSNIPDALTTFGVFSLFHYRSATLRGNIFLCIRLHQTVCSAALPFFQGKNKNKMATGGQPEAAAAAAAVAAPGQPDDLVGTFNTRWINADHASKNDGWFTCTDIRRDFQYVKILGAGRSGRTFLVVHRPTNTPVALKLCSVRRLARGVMQGLATEDEEDDHPQFKPEVIMRHLQEMRLEKLLVRCLNGLSPFICGMANVAPIVPGMQNIGMMAFTSSVCDLSRGELGYSVELMHGRASAAWTDWVRKSNPSQFAKDELLIFWAAQLADAIRFLHECRVCHKDFALRNVLVGSDGYLKVTDFGCSYVVEHPHNTPAPLSVADLNREGADGQRSRGPPEEVWNRQRGTQRRDHPERVQRGLPLDLHMFGYSLIRLTHRGLQRTSDMPIDYSDVEYAGCSKAEHPDLKFEDWAPSYKITTKLLTGNQIFEDFIQRLTTPIPSNRIGYNRPRELIEHPVFTNVNFDLLRQKQLAAPLDQHLFSYLNQPVEADDVEEFSSPWTYDTAEKEFSRYYITEQERLFIWNTYEESG